MIERQDSEFFFQGPRVREGTHDATTNDIVWRGRLVVTDRQNFETMDSMVRGGVATELPHEMGNGNSMNLAFCCDN